MDEDGSRCAFNALKALICVVGRWYALNSVFVSLPLKTLLNGELQVELCHEIVKCNCHSNAYG